MTTSLVKVEQTALSEVEKEEYQYHSLQVQQAIAKGQDARRQLITHVLYILENNLWRENYSSSEEYIRTELNLEVSSFWREAKNNRNYLYLLSNAEDTDEEITLTRMRDAGYRELRRLATEKKPMLKKGGESEEEYKMRLAQKEEEDSQSILELWKEIYPRIIEFKQESGTGIYPTGGYSITSTDIFETCKNLQPTIEIVKLLDEGVDPADIRVHTPDNEDMSLKEVLDESGEYGNQVIETLANLSVKNALVEKLKRHHTHIRDALEKKYHYDRHDGMLMFINGRLVIRNQFGDIDLLNEWSDMLGKETQVSIRRVARDI